MTTQRTNYPATAMDTWPTFGHVTSMDIHMFCPGLSPVGPDDLDFIGESPHDDSSVQYPCQDLRRFAAAGILYRDTEHGYRTSVDAANEAYQHAGDNFEYVTGGRFGRLDQLPDEGAIRVVLSCGGAMVNGVDRAGQTIWSMFR